jgi:hypothetical protein
VDFNCIPVETCGRMSTVGILVVENCFQFFVDVRSTVKFDMVKLVVYCFKAGD